MIDVGKAREFRHDRRWMTSSYDDAGRLRLCLDSLDGLSVGDALGAQFFVPGRSVSDLSAGLTPPDPWPWTDDTEMACSIVRELHEHRDIDRDRLALAFAERCEPYRGYGGGAVAILHRIRDGVPWREAAADAFDGTGSCGNGAAMRVPPLGAYHAGDLDRAASEAIASAEVTHAHPEGILGAVAVAVAASAAAGARAREAVLRPEDLLDAVDPYVPGGAVRRGLSRARNLLGAPVDRAAYELGNGAHSTAQDTVPFTLWAAATRLGSYRDAIVDCVRAGGDVDTTAAIVGGIVAAYTGVGTPAGVPASWLAQREPLPDWTQPPTA